MPRGQKHEGGLSLEASWQCFPAVDLRKRKQREAKGAASVCSGYRIVGLSRRNRGFAGPTGPTGTDQAWCIKLEVLGSKATIAQDQGVALPEISTGFSYLWILLESLVGPWPSWSLSKESGVICIPGLSLLQLNCS